MSWHADQLKYALGLGGLFSFYGAVTVGVWLVGDKFGADNTYKIVVIAVVLLTLPFALVGGFVVSRRNRKKEEAQKLEADAAQQAEAGAATATAQKLSKPSGKYDELTTAAEEVVQFLKSSNLGAGKDALYALPWYLVAGTPKSGKTSLVLSSGLNFQNLPSQRQSEQKFVRPTRSVDWRVTSDAVFLDTAGRYQTEGADEDEWSSLLDTIKKYRGQRPLDGMILTVSAERILHADEAEIEQTAKVLRARLDEAAQRMKTRFPIYLVFTHADAIEGFRDSFSTSQREGENLVWGATVPLDQTANAHQMFDGEYDLLQQSVMKRRIIRLSAPFAPVRQLKIFNFPLHFGSARRKLGAFVSTLLRPNPFSESPFLRGFYFTAVPINRQAARRGGAGQTLSGAAQTIGQSFFAEKLFRDVVLRDKDLVATAQAQKVRPPLLGWALTAAGSILTVLFLAFSAFSLYQNKQMLNEAQQRGDALLNIVKADTGKNPLDKKPEEASAEIDAIENLRKSLVQLDNNEREGAPLSMRFGLYSGSRIYRERLLHIYFNAIEHRFKRPTVKRLEDDLRKFSSGQQAATSAQLTAQEEENLGNNYKLLKAYLMLSDKYKDNAEGAFLAQTLKDYWKTESKNPGGSDLITQQQLDFYAKQIDRQELEKIKLDAALVEAARKRLQAFPAVFRYYNRKVSEISKEVDSRIGAKTVENVLSRNGGDTSFIEGKYQVPGAYTIEGYQLMKTAIADSDKELSQDDWVMGEQGKNAVVQATDASRLEERYLRDYADQWKAYVQGVDVKYKKENAAKALQAFSSVNSPMEILLADVAANTNFSAKPKTSGWIDWIKSFFVTPKTETNGTTAVEKEFRPLFPFVGGDKPESAPIAKYRSEIGKVSKKVGGFSAGELNQIAKDLAVSEEKDKLGLKNSEDNINSLVSSFGETPSGQEMENLLKEPLGNLRVILGADFASQIKKNWTEAILPKAKDAEKGYPFEDGATEADLKKLSDYLNPVSGAFSKFYAESLEKYFEPAGDGVKVKADGKIQFTDEFIVYVNNALRLRKALFGDGASASFGYDFKLQKIDGALIEVTIDGQKIDSNGTGSTTMKFPAASGETGAFMNFASTSATTSAVAAPIETTTANASGSNVNTSNDTNSAVKTPTPTISGGSQSGSSSLKYPGTWGLFRFFEAGSPAKQPGGDYLLTYKLGGKTVAATVKPSGGDLFDRSIFKSLRAPQDISR